MSARVPLFFTIALIFASLPACQKPAPPPTPEQIAAAEKEISDMVFEVVNTTIHLEEATTPGKALAYKEELDVFKAKLVAIREKNKSIIPMDRSEELAEDLVEEGVKKERKGLKELKDKFEEDDQKRKDEELKRLLR